MHNQQTRTEPAFSETITLLTTEPAWREAAEVLKVLRPMLDVDEFVRECPRLLKEGYCLLGLRTDGVIAAVASYIISPHPVYYRELQIHDMATLPEYQSKGFGSKLLAELDRIAEQQKCGRCSVNSRTEREDAHRFYRKNGFQDYSAGFIKRID